MKVLISPASGRLSNRTYGKTYNIVENLAAPDIEIELVVDQVEDSLTTQNVRVRALGTNSRPRYYLRAFVDAWRQLRSGEFDLYHHMNLSYRWFNPVLVARGQGDVPVVIGPAQASHSLPSDELRMKLGWIAGRDSPGPLVDILRGTISRTLPVAGPARRYLFERTLAQADAIAVVNEETRDIYSRHVSREKLHVIPIGVDIERFGFSEERTDGKIVSVGWLIERKGFDHLLDALPIIRSEIPNATLHILGDGPRRDELERQAEENDVDDDVRFHGHVPQETVRDHLQSAAVFVHPSLSESFSPIRLEAMATGCPIVGTNVTGAGEMIRDGVDGFVVPTGSADVLAERVTDILADRELAREMGRAARSRTEESYSWRTVGDAYIDLYRSVMG